MVFDSIVLDLLRIPRHVFTSIRVTEALNPVGVEFGEEKLRSILVESLRLSARELVKKVIANVLEWQGQASQHDDITLIVVKVK